MSKPTPRIIKVIFTEVIRGGSEGFDADGKNRVRCVREYHSLKGKFLGEYDPRTVDDMSLAEKGERLQRVALDSLTHGLRNAIKAGRLRRCSATDRKYVEQLLAKAEGTNS